MHSMLNSDQYPLSYLATIHLVHGLRSILIFQLPMNLGRGSSSALWAVVGPEFLGSGISGSIAHRLICRVNKINLGRRYSGWRGTSESETHLLSFHKYCYIRGKVVSRAQCYCWVHSEILFTASYTRAKINILTHEQYRLWSNNT